MDIKQNKISLEKRRLCLEEKKKVETEMHTIFVCKKSKWNSWKQKLSIIEKPDTLLKLILWRNYVYILYPYKLNKCWCWRCKCYVNVYFKDILVVSFFHRFEEIFVEIEIQFVWIIS